MSYQRLKKGGQVAKSEFLAKSVQKLLNKKTGLFSKKVLPHRQIKYQVDFDDELKTRKRQIR